MGDCEVTSVDEDATTVFTEDLFTGATDVAIAGIGDETINGATVVEEAGTITCILSGIFPCPVAGIDAETNTCIIAGLGNSVFTKVTGY